MALTKTAKRVLHTMIRLTQDTSTGWVPIPGLPGNGTIRWDQVNETPEYMRGTGFGKWPEPTYESHVWITLVAGKVILGVAHSPVTGRQDRDIPFWLAEKILTDPALALDPERLRRVKDMRRISGGHS